MWPSCDGYEIRAGEVVTLKEAEIEAVGSPLLEMIRPETIHKAVYDAENQNPQLVWRRIAALFLHEFGPGDMDLILGSVICDLPKEAFDKLLEAYPFFILLKGVATCQQIHGAGRSDIPLVFFSQSELKDMNFSERRGVVVHELAHVVAGHLSAPFSLDDPWKEKREEEADSLACSWGLGDEIDAIRRFIKMKGERGKWKKDHKHCMRS